MDQSHDGASSKCQSFQRGKAFKLTPEGLKALVEVQLGAERWQSGLTSLGRRTYRSRTTQPLKYLEDWGVIVVLRDELRWRYYLSPSPLGHLYLRMSKSIPALRAQVIEGKVDSLEECDDFGTK